MLAQERVVDWFSYWLKGEEDPNPAKAEECVRWRELRKEYTAMHSMLSRGDSPSGGTSLNNGLPRVVLLIHPLHTRPPFFNPVLHLE
jgi:hypothetical protein